MQARTLFIALLALSLGHVACKSGQPAPQPDETASGTISISASDRGTASIASPRRIILFLGDGMGVGAVTAGAYSKGQPLEMMSMTTVSWMRNHEYEYVTTDSAASATAFATGSKTHYEGVSVKPGTTAETETDPENHLASIVRYAEKRGMKTGLVATSRINHATPAAFAANRHHRKSYEEIALDISRSGVDVLLGAGTDFFEKRKDGVDLMSGYAESGYTIARSAQDVRKAAKTADKLVGLMHPRDMPMTVEGGRAMSLRDMTRTAIDVLDRNNDEGWFLLVEGSQIDWCAHDLAAGCTVAEVLDFDAAVGAGLDYARGRDDTLVVVTADHDTAGVSVIDPRYTNRFAEAFGGEEAAAAAAAPPAELDPPMQVERIPAHFAVGSKSWQMALEPVDASEPVFGFTALEDWRYTLSFGHLSVQSRTLLKQGEQRDFYGTHTTTHVPLFAEGPGAVNVSQVRDNAELGRQLIAFVEDSTTILPLQPVDSTPKNVVVMIGDGMGINPVTAAYYANGGLFMTGAPITGMVSTHAADTVVNDSAASATAIATAKRSRRGAVGMVDSPDGLVSAESILELAERRGHKTGLVTTTQLTHATPAAFYAHVPSRSDDATIADQFLNLRERIEGSDGIDVAIAGGLAYFDEPRQKRLAELGYELRTEWSADVPKGQMVSLLAPKGVPNARMRHRDGNPDTPSLAEMTQLALDALASQSDDTGFFLMVEGGQIDWLMHSMVDDATLVDEVVDFDQAVEAVVRWAEARGDTLVVVTADHDHTLSVVDNHYAFYEKQNCRASKWCDDGAHDYPAIDIRPEGIEGGEGLTDSGLQGEGFSPKIHLQYGWIVQEASKRKRVSGPHSANFVPLFAWGPGAGRFGGYIDQPELGATLRRVAGFEPDPDSETIGKTAGEPAAD